MKLFIWTFIGGLTDSYHDGGALVVMAKSLKSAKKQHTAIEDNKPDFVFELSENSKTIDEPLVFPDAGCC